MNRQSGAGRARRRTGGSAGTRKNGKAALLVSIPSETAFLSLVRELTRKMAGTAGFDEGTSDRISLAVDEATTNVIEHAYHGATDRQVEVRFEDRGLEFRVEVLDTGDMVDPRAVPRVDLERYVTERRTGGLGVHLMERIMDSVTFRRSARRNVCCLLKRKETQEPDGR